MRFCIISNHHEALDNLVKYLKNHPDVRMRDNVFAGVKAGKNHGVLDALWLEEDKHKAVGFAVQYGRLDPWIADYLRGNNIEVIMIVRPEKTHVKDGMYKDLAKLVMNTEGLKPSRRNKWETIKSRRELLVDFLKVEDKVLSL